MPKIDQAAIGSTVIPVPSLGDQRQIVEGLTSNQEVERRLAETLVIQSKREQSLRRALLAAAFAGQLTGRASELARVEELAAAGAAR